MTLPEFSAATLEAWAVFVLGNWILQSSLLLGLGLAVTSLRRLSSGARHMIALSALILAALSPLTMAVPHPLAARVEAPATVRSLTLNFARSAVRPVEPAAVASSKASLPAPATWLMMGWAFGCVLRLLWLLGGSVQVAAWLRRSRKIDSRSLAERWGYDAAGLDIRTTTDLTRPAVAGVLRPAILLPVTLLERDDEALRPVLLHEGAHYRRRDPLRLLLAETVGAILFWHPLSWALRRQLDRLAEEACDREVLAKGIAPGDYARTLLELLTPPSGRRIALACSLGRAGRELQRRIDALFHLPAQSSRLATLGAALLVIPAIAGALSIETGSRPLASRPNLRNIRPNSQTVRRAQPVRAAKVAIKPVAIPEPLSTRAEPIRAALSRSVGGLRMARFEPRLASAQSREPISGQVVVFLLDISSSMRPYQEAARRDLLDRVASLRTSDSFNIVAFATEQHRFAPDPVPADETTRAGVEAWLTTLPQASGTCPLPALELALATPGAGSVVLISDKQTASGPLGEQVEGLVRQHNASHVTVLAVTLGEPAASGVTGVPAPMGIFERVVAAEESAAPL
jgi:beta-lactamase regulating signal transducer with metallopeptidase domain